ncbi:MAG: sulfatase-like hydrolase/transferase [Pirellulales bacterium]|nr:sulfatase-like hydrolase/transferase [Pirellulales bacterium]
MKYSPMLLPVVLLTTIGFRDTAAAASRPNVLMIVSEDNGPELGCYGDPYARTPNLDRLASEGVRFARAFVARAG